MESNERTALDAAIAAVGEVYEVQSTKFCKDCKWCSGDPRYTRAICTSPQAPTSVVTGERYDIACELMRSVRVSPGGFPTCTVNGHWFVAKEQAP